MHACRVLAKRQLSGRHSLVTPSRADLAGRPAVPGTIRSIHPVTRTRARAACPRFPGAGQGEPEPIAAATSSSSPAAGSASRAYEITRHHVVHMAPRARTAKRRSSTIWSDTRTHPGRPPAHGYTVSVRRLSALGIPAFLLPHGGTRSARAHGRARMGRVAVHPAPCTACPRTHGATLRSAHTLSRAMTPQLSRHAQSSPRLPLCVCGGGARAHHRAGPAAVVMARPPPGR